MIYEHWLIWVAKCWLTLVLLYPPWYVVRKTQFTPQVGKAIQMQPCPINPLSKLCMQVPQPGRFYSVLSLPYYIILSWKLIYNHYFLIVFFIYSLILIISYSHLPNSHVFWPVRQVREQSHTQSCQSEEAVLPVEAAGAVWPRRATGHSHTSRGNTRKLLRQQTVCLWFPTAASEQDHRQVSVPSQRIAFFVLLQHLGSES